MTRNEQEDVENGKTTRRSLPPPCGKARRSSLRPNVVYLTCCRFEKGKMMGWTVNVCFKRRFVRGRFGKFSKLSRDEATDIYLRYRDSDVRSRECIIDCWVQDEHGLIILGDEPDDWSPESHAYESGF
jgi:hypothetical protein